MDQDLLAIIINNVVLPEVIEAIRRRQEAGQPLPTAEELYAELNLDVETLLAKGANALAEIQRDVDNSKEGPIE